MRKNQGLLQIESTPGKGTAIKLTFPRTKAPAWILEDIGLGRDDIVIILDDEHSIHAAWDRRFKSLLAESPQLKLHHFHEGEDALRFIEGLSGDEKERVFLLTDYELLNQRLTGIDVIRQSHLKRTGLVTSHFWKLDLREEVVQVGTKMLPKQLASEVGIRFVERELLPLTEGLKQVDLIYVEDDECLAKTVPQSLLKDYVVAHYFGPSASFIGVPEVYIYLYG